MKNLFNKLKAFITGEIIQHWSRPKKGEYVSYKEIVAYSLGHFGREFIGLANGVFGLAVTNIFLAFVIGIRPMHLALMGTISGFVGLVFPIIRAKMVDNTRTKWGRFRPYITVFGFVIYGLSILLAFLPYDGMAYTEMLVWVFAIHLVQSFVAPLYFEATFELGTVITPNANERSKVISIAAIIYSLAPTITSSLIPALAGLAIFDHSGFMAINFYRFVMIPIGGIGLFFNMFFLLGTRERVVTEKKYTPKVPTIKGMFLIFKNKYWWIRQLNGIFGLTSGWAFALLNWMFMFRYQNMAILAVFQLPLGTASLVSLIITPIFIRKFNSVKAAIWRNVVAALVLMALWAFSANIWLFMIFWWVLVFLWDTDKVTGQMINGNVKDFTQYQTGKRMDFTFAAAGLAMFPIGMLMGFAQPLFMEFFGFTGDANIFFDPAMNQTYFGWIFVLGAIGCLMGVALMAMYFDLNEIKHKQIMAALKYRAAMKDLKDDVLTPKQIKEAVELINKAKETSNTDVPNLDELKKAYWADYKKFKFKDAKPKRKEYVKARDLADEIKSAKLLIAEKNKFEEDKFLIFKVELAEKLAEKPLETLNVVDDSFKEYALSLPNGTVDEKKKRLYALSFARRTESMAKKVNKKFPNGLENEFDMSALLEAADKKVEVGTKRAELILQKPETDEQKEAQKAEVTALFKELQEAKRIIHEEEKKLMKYNIVFWHYNNAKELLRERDSFMHYPELLAMYDQAVIDVEQEEKDYQEKVAQEKADKQAEKERLAAEREAKKKSEKE